MSHFTSTIVAIKISLARNVKASFPKCTTWSMAQLRATGSFGSYCSQTEELLNKFLYSVSETDFFWLLFWPYSMCGTSCWWSLFLLLSLTSLEYGILVSQSCMFWYVAEVNLKNTVFFPLRTSVWHQNAAAELVLVCFQSSNLTQ